jgi:hypothetical protein
MDGGEFPLLAEATASFKLLLTLSGEADDDISGNGGMGHYSSNQFHCPLIFGW